MIKLFKANIWGIVVILAGSITWSLTMVKSGIVYAYGMGFWGPNGHDGVWHISVIESLARDSLNIPIFAGEALQNYHIGFDLAVVFLHKLILLPVSTLYFQLIPVILAVGVGASAYYFVLDWTKSKLAAFWATFFVYFGGSWGWVVTMFHSGQLGGESMFWAQQSVSTLVNPPFAMSLVFMFVGLHSVIRAMRIKDKKLLTLTTFVFGILIMVKVYAGLLILGALLVTGVYQMVVRREGIALLKVFAGTLILSLLLFLPFVTSTRSALIWSPFWFVESMMQLSDRVGWTRYGEAMVNYRLGGQWIKAIAAYTVGFGIFLFGNLGTRILSFLYVGNKLIKKVKFDYVDVMIVIIILAGVVVPLFFVQSGTPWNTIQFFYYSLVFSGILAGVVFGEWMKNGSAAKYIVAGLVIFITIPTTYTTLSTVYLPGRPPAKLSTDEMQALEFLSNQPDGVVLTYPFDAVAARDAVNNPPRPLYLYESTAYVSAFGQKDVYMEDEVNLNITGYDWSGRRKDVENFLSTLNQAEARHFLQESNIKYIYWVDGQRATLGETQLGIEKIFENGLVDIYKVNN